MGGDVIRRQSVKLTFARFSIAVMCVTFLSSAPSIFGQEARTGYPQDWSQNHIVFSADGLAKHPDVIYKEPRVLQKVLQHFQVPTFGTFESAEPLSTSAKISGPENDWSVALSGRLVANAAPAKYSFYPNTAPSCTADWVVFALAGANTANLVAFNNLYVNSAGTGYCPGKAPSVLFAYNVTTQAGGKMTTSPVISVDGTKIAFVESVPAGGTAGAPAAAIFHVITWSATGTLKAPAIPTTNMVSLTLASNANDTVSSPWVDYGTDTAYIGTDNGVLHEVTGVFKGTPTLDPVGSNFPVTVSAGLHLSPPVFDVVDNLVMVGSANGDLYQVNAASGVVIALPIGSGPNSGIVAAPIVDITNGTTFVITANVGYAAALVQVNTHTMHQLAIAELGEGSSEKPSTAITLYEPTLSNAYYTNPTSGVITACGTGTTDTTPWQYVFGFASPTQMLEAPSFKQQLTNSTAARCTGWTEFFNANLGTDFFFFGLTEDCGDSTGGAADGCIAEVENLSPTTIIAPLTTATVSGGPSGVTVDNYANTATYPEASSIYFTAENLQTAYKLAQNGLGSN
jgi:hypothetical protein